MQYDMVIQRHELKSWLKDNPTCKDYLSQGYRDTISDIKRNVFSDYRARLNDHIVNYEFRIDPKYFFSFRIDPIQSHLMIIGCLYVFPNYRKEGFGSHMINRIKDMVRENVVQVAVEAEKCNQLTPFYQRHGFKTTGKINTNELGRGYVDFFWSAKNYELSAGDKWTVLEPRPYDL